MSFLSNLFSSRGAKPQVDRGAATEAFWVWFQENRAFLENYLEDTTAVVRAIGERLDEVDPLLAFELGQANDGVYEFIVSADGISDVFPSVMEFTKSAPSIEGWRIISFRPRKAESLGNTVTFEGIELPTTALWYQSQDSEDRIDITLYVEDADTAEAHGLLGPVFILLDATLGEYDVSTKIGVIEFGDWPGPSGRASLKPIADLAREVDSRFH